MSLDAESRPAKSIGKSRDFHFPASVLIASSLQHHARISLVKLANVAKRCQEGLREMNYPSLERNMPAFPKLTTPLEWRHASENGCSPMAKRRLHLPKTSHLINPKGPGENDRSALEKTVNVVTSLPFLAVGAHTLNTRPSGDKEGRVFGWSMLAMGSAATLYHAAGGKVRGILRKVDYYTISLSCMAMQRSLQLGACERRGQAARFLSLAALPFRPTAVTAYYAAKMEIAYAKRAQSCAELRRRHHCHVAATSAGLGCFALEGAAIKHGFGFTHPLWHCLACYALSSVSRPAVCTA